MSKSSWSPVRTAICLAFFTNGFLTGTWIVHIPRIKQALGASDGELGLLLWGATVGLLVGIISSGPLVGRVGSRRLTGFGAMAQAIGTIAPVVAENRVALFAGLCVYGFCSALLDVAQNAQASHLERESGRSLMSSFHAFWSFGGFGGGAVGGLLMSWSVAPWVHVSGCAVVFLLVAAWILRVLPEVAADRQQGGVTFAVPSGPLFPLAAVCYLAMFAEHAIADWSGVLLRTGLKVAAPTAAIGYTAFLLAMVGARLIGDRIVETFRPVATVARPDSCRIRAGIGRVRQKPSPGGNRVCICGVRPRQRRADSFFCGGPDRASDRRLCHRRSSFGRVLRNLYRSGDCRRIGSVAESAERDAGRRVRHPYRPGHHRWPSSRLFECSRAFKEE